jgi:hypothetical protein
MRKPLDHEIETIADCHRALTRSRLAGRAGHRWLRYIDPNAQARVLFYLAVRLGITQRLKTLLTEAR